MSIEKNILIMYIYIETKSISHHSGRPLLTHEGLFSRVPSGRENDYGSC